MKGLTESLELSPDIMMEVWAASIRFVSASLPRASAIFFLYTLLICSEFVFLGIPSTCMALNS